MTRAAVLVEANAPLEIDEIEVDGPLADEVGVAVAACAVCRSDVSFFDGHWATDLPAVFGHEAVGRVTEVGSEVNSIEVGDRVSVSLIRSCGACRHCRAGRSVICEAGDRRADSPLSSADGRSIVHGLGVAGFADQAIVHRSQVVVIPEDVPPVSAALLGCAVITGFGAVTKRARLQRGSTAVVIGCGGVGLNSIQAARIAGASVIVGVDAEPAKLAAARRLGATHTADPSSVDVVRAFAEAGVGGGADHVFVTVGSKAATESAFSLLAPGGTLVLVGMMADGVTIDVDATTLAALNQTVLGSKMGSATPADDIPRLVELYRSGDLELDGLVSDTFPLEQINEAVAASRRPDARRVVVTMED